MRMIHESAAGGAALRCEFKRHCHGHDGSVSATQAVEIQVKGGVLAVEPRTECVPEEQDAQRIEVGDSDVQPEVHLPAVDQEGVIEVALDRHALL